MIRTTLSYCSTPNFCPKMNFTLAEPGRTRQHPSEDLDSYVKRYHEKALDFRVPMVEDVLVDVSFHGII